jgi:predicted DNA-binding transcriptional regulator AlpA
MRPLLTSQQAAEHLGVSERHMARQRRAGTGPRYIRIGKTKDVRYPPEEVESWVASSLVSSTSEEQHRTMSQANRPKLKNRQLILSADNVTPD